MTILAPFLLASALSVPQRSADAAQSLAHAQESEPIASQQALIGVRILKIAAAGDLDWRVQLPADCNGCQLLINDLTSAQNPKEFYFHFLAPNTTAKVKGVRVKVDASKVRGVIVGRMHVPFVRTEDGVTFDAPQHEPEDHVAELHTTVEAPGIRIRVEHADEQRRRGPYATGPWPVVQRQAALNLEFAAREAIRILRLDRLVQERGLGVIQLMGFDTNYPTVAPDRAHMDFPPHWHMHVYWTSDPKIRTIDHQFIGADGLLTHNMVAKDKHAGPTQREGRFERGQIHEVLTPDGDVLFTQMITSNGHFVLGAKSGSCRFTPVGGGFQNGVELACDNSKLTLRVRADDDIEVGLLRLFIDGRLVEQHFYDIDTGTLQRSDITYRDR